MVALAVGEGKCPTQGWRPHGMCRQVPAALGPTLAGASAPVDLCVGAQGRVDNSPGWV